jgi:hypothetical protein
VFLVAVDHFRRVIYVGKACLGSNNDVTIARDDVFIRRILNGLLNNVKYQLFDASGRKYWAKGGYLICDGGFIDHVSFIDPEKHRMERERILWSEWIESVRKDVECKI